MVVEGRNNEGGAGWTVEAEGEGEAKGKRGYQVCVVLRSGLCCRLWQCLPQVGDVEGGIYM